MSNRWAITGKRGGAEALNIDDTLDLEVPPVWTAHAGAQVATFDSEDDAKQWIYRQLLTRANVVGTAYSPDGDLLGTFTPVPDDGGRSKTIVSVHVRSGHVMKITQVQEIGGRFVGIVAGRIVQL